MLILINWLVDQIIGLILQFKSIWPYIQFWDCTLESIRVHSMKFFTELSAFLAYHLTFFLYKNVLWNNCAKYFPLFSISECEMEIYILTCK